MKKKLTFWPEKITFYNFIIYFVYNIRNYYGSVLLNVTVSTFLQYFSGLYKLNFYDF